ncbi:MAG TPA: hypothetical protein VFP55_03390 [Solirubrobacteraceae bacterium]|nr:hypothetical protein [Solirubrobacteraceae bacterium]
MRRRPRTTTSARSRRVAADRGNALTGGGTDGNEVLTTATGVVLLVLLAALGITILLIGQLLYEHLFLGFLLLGPIGLKMASTGYRFSRYYTGKRTYVEKGPPWWPLRLTAPFVLALTLIVFGSGIALVAVGPLNPNPWLLLHKASFILWLGVTSLHVLGHLPEVSRLLGLRNEILQLPGVRTDIDRIRFAEAHPGASTPPSAAAEARVARGPGSAGRLLLLAGSIVVGLIIALALVPDFHTWVTLQPLLHHGDH